jgi:hypothetical protein
MLQESAQMPGINLDESITEITQVPNQLSK